MSLRAPFHHGLLEVQRVSPTRAIQGPPGGWLHGAGLRERPCPGVQAAFMTLGSQES